MTSKNSNRKTSDSLALIDRARIQGWYLTCRAYQAGSRYCTRDGGQWKLLSIFNAVDVSVVVGGISSISAMNVGRSP
jgi:hypothetical protein